MCEPGRQRLRAHQRAYPEDDDRTPRRLVGSEAGVDRGALPDGKALSLVQPNTKIERWANIDQTVSSHHVERFLEQGVFRVMSRTGEDTGPRN